MPPPAAPTATGMKGLLWVLFGLSGRIGRQVYWLALLAPQALMSALLFQVVGGAEASMFEGASTLLPVLVLPALWSNIAVAVKRLHDIGLIGFWSLVVLIPLVNIAFTLWLGIVPGEAGPNAYGDRANAPPR